MSPYIASAYAPARVHKAVCIVHHAGMLEDIQHYAFCATPEPYLCKFGFSAPVTAAAGSPLPKSFFFLAKRNNTFLRTIQGCY